MDVVTLSAAKAAAKAAQARLGAQNSRKPIDPRAVLSDPRAPLARVVAAAPPTVTISTSAPSGVRYDFIQSGATTPVGNKYMTPCAGDNWIQSAPSAISGWAQQRSAADVSQANILNDPAAVLLGFDGLAITFMVKSNANHRYRFQVDDEYLSLLPTNGPGGVTTQYITLTFATAVPRRIRFEQYNGFFYGVYVAANDTPPWAVAPRGPKVVVLGDSYLAGHEDLTTPAYGYGAFTSGLGVLADHLGWENVTNAAIAGTGYILTTGGLPNNAQNRAAQAATWNPDLLVLAYGRNDSSFTAAQITAAVTATLNTLRTALPDVPIIVFGPFFGGAPIDGSRDSTWGPVEDAILAGLLPVHRAVFVSTAASGIFTGTGKQGTAGTGNGNTYISSDGTHPVQAGADYFGRRLAAKMLSAVGSL